MFRLFFVALFLIAFVILTAPIALIAWIIGFFNSKLRYQISMITVGIALKILFFLTGSKLTVNGLENIPQESVLFIGNHTSYFDIVVSYMTINHRTGFIGKDDLAKIPGLNWWLLLLDGLFLNRKDPRKGLEMVNKAADNITKGISVFIFPEGTRSKTGELGEFKEGSFKIAAKSNCKIVPVAIKGTADIFENHLPSIKPSNVTITFGEAIETVSLSRVEKKTLGAMTRSRIEEILKNDNLTKSK
ncbi:MAG: 1-acyl-sn-glycerol-3-phosphate acyltransferase [Lachnospiraceae bacterium]|nr:1-acyl-sn-glycerol-3-phosphate acyltransferase [Lachnospiraceae bacterium]